MFRTRVPVYVPRTDARYSVAGIPSRREYPKSLSCPPSRLFFFSTFGQNTDPPIRPLVTTPVYSQTRAVRAMRYFLRIYLLHCCFRPLHSLRVYVVLFILVCPRMKSASCVTLSCAACGCMLCPFYIGMSPRRGEIELLLLLCCCLHTRRLKYHWGQRAPIGIIDAYTHTINKCR